MPTICERNEENIVKLSSFHSHDTRNKNKFDFPIHETTKFEMSPHCQSIKIFNNLPRTIQSLPNNKFKKIVRKLSLRECFYSVKDYFSYNFSENCCVTE